MVSDRSKIRETVYSVAGTQLCYNPTKLDDPKRPGFIKDVRGEDVQDFLRELDIRHGMEIPEGTPKETLGVPIDQWGHLSGWRGSIDLEKTVETFSGEE